MSRETITAIKFGPEQAGERFAWAYAERVNEIAVCATLTGARVGNEGASVYARFTDDGTLVRSGYDSPGAENPYHVELVFTTDTDELEVAHIDRVASEGWPNRTSFPLASVWKHVFDKEPRGEWAAGVDIPRVVRQILSQGDMADAYTPLYYYTAIIADRASRPLDLTMSEKTSRQIEVADNVRKVLVEARRQSLQLKLDIENAKTNYLPYFADREFVESRRKAAELNGTFLEAVAKGAFKGARLYPPMGQGRSGRSWPYMDATVADEQTAFGLEKEALRNMEPGRVVGELEREIREFEGRIEYAAMIQARLSTLAEDEQGLEANV